MIRGTTPTLTFTMPFDCAEITAVSVAFAQCGVVMVEKKLSDCTIEGMNLVLTLSEDETLLLDSSKNLKIQVRCAIGDVKMASNIFDVDVGEILKDGCLE